MQKILFYSVLALTVSISSANGNTSDFETLLKGWSESFLTKVGEDYQDTLNFRLNDNNSHWYVTFSKGNYSIHQGENPDAKFIFTADMETYRKLYKGKLSPITAIGRASINEPAPLDFILQNGMTVGNVNWSDAYFTLINFFNPHPNNKIVLGQQYSRSVHGGNVIGLYYSVGFRSAWYHINKGEMLNEAGEKDPFEQSFIILKGSGYAKIGKDTIVVNENEAYYIRPNLEHKIWTESEEGVTLLWNAWGKEAW